MRYRNRYMVLLFLVICMPLSLIGCQISSDTVGKICSQDQATGKPRPLPGFCPAPGQSAKPVFVIFPNASSPPIFITLNSPFPSGSAQPLGTCDFAKRDGAGRKRQAQATCSNGLTPEPVNGPYAGIGASEAVGIGASAPCGLLTPILPACPGGTGYVPKIAALLAAAGISAPLTDLGISGAVIAADIRTQGNLYGTVTVDKCQARTGFDIILSDFLTDEVPKLPDGVAYVTIIAGANDAIALTSALGCGAGGGTAATQQAYISNAATLFAKDYAALLTAVKQANPNAQIVVANIPNLAGIPSELAKSTTERQALQEFSIALDTVIDALTAQNIPVVDLLCMPSSYASANFASDGFHPNDAGYAIIASQMEPLLLSRAVSPLSATCAQATLASASKKAFSRFTLHVPPPAGNL
jgi:lysophospholipase L1-like esterase